MVCDQARAREIRHLRHLCQPREPQRPLEWPDCKGIGGASQRIAGGSPASRKSGGPCKHPVKGLSARFQVSKQQGERNNNNQGEKMTIQKKEMKTAQMYRADSAPQTAKSAIRGRMQRLGLTVLAFALVIGVTGSASASQAQDEAAVRALGDNFAKAFVQKNPEQRASLFTENGTFVTPQGDFLQGRVVMVKDFGSEAQAVTPTTQAAFSNYRIRFLKPDVAVADALLTLHNINGPDGTIIPTIPVNFFYVASRHGNQWLIEDGRAHFAPAPANSMTSHN